MKCQHAQTEQLWGGVVQLKDRRQSDTELQTLPRNQPSFCDQKKKKNVPQAL